MEKEQISEYSLYKNVRLNFIFSIIASLELIAVSIVTLTILPDPKNAWLLGFSRQRWLLMLVAIFLAIIIFFAGKVAYAKKITFASIMQNKENSFNHRLLVTVIFLLLLWGWSSIFCPAYLFGYGASYFERLRPLSIAVGLIVFQFFLLSLFLDKKITTRSLKNLILNGEIPRESIFFAICLIALFLFIATTKIGLVQETGYWNVPGIPLSGLQFLAIVVIVGLGIYLIPKDDQSFSPIGLRRFYRFIPFLIYLGAVLTWGLTPMDKHYFSLTPTSPNYQPFPYSDARVYDIGGISLLEGERNYFQKSTDKPLYMVFLALLHIIAGYDYSLLTWLQIIVLAFIPVILYFLGKNFYSKNLGIFLALVTILRQRNAIALSFKVASVNPKLFITEVMTLLGVVLFTYLVFLWLKNQKYWLAILSGGVIGAASLIRLNPIFLFLGIACLALLVLWKFSKSKWKHLTFYTLGFLIVFIPWIFIGVHPKTGMPWAFVKAITIINGRYINIMHPSGTPVPSATISVTTIVGTPESALIEVTPNLIYNLGQQSADGISPEPKATQSLSNSSSGNIYQSSSIIPHYIKIVQPLGTALPSATIPVTPMANPESTPFVVATEDNKPPVQLPALSNSPQSKDTQSLLNGLDQNNIQFPVLFINHFLHNFSTSLLSLPDSLIYDDLDHLAQREYWIDLNKWQGNFPPEQIVFILFNLIMIAVGLGYSWHQYRWIGFIPLVIFISYAISLAFGISSGSRYIVPIDWILYFYYGLGIVILIRKVVTFIRGKEASLDETRMENSLQPSADRKRFWFSFFGLVIIGCIIPIANLGLPANFRAPENSPEMEALTQTIPSNQRVNAMIIYGEVLYPYYNLEGTLDFVLMKDKKITSYSINLDNLDSKVKLIGGELLFLVKLPENGVYIVKSIYMKTGSTLVLIWELGSKN